MPCYEFTFRNSRSNNGGKANRAKAQTKSTRAGLVFSVGRFQSRLKKDRFAERVGVGAAIFMTAVIEYMTAEVLELAGNAADNNKKKRISPRHILLAVRGDEELSKILGQVTFAQEESSPSSTSCSRRRRARPPPLLPTATPPRRSKASFRPHISA
ncbi:hypothetical protein L596_015483 [Steinernema carpocapsae]|uniref:Histone H2A n=1 Tax=Steinernema carpocapsae TaxID=34508 RepID=A0A4U5NFQ7_STECR|nr:hypothetical protein L596_015483 [Steinernema carpocapsae]